MPVTIRALALGDLLRLRSLSKEGWGNMRLARVAGDLFRGNTVLGYCLTPELPVGLIAYAAGSRRWPEYTDVRYLYVDPRSRQQSVATALWRAMTERTTTTARVGAIVTSASGAGFLAKQKVAMWSGRWGGIVIADDLRADRDPGVGKVCPPRVSSFFGASGAHLLTPEEVATLRDCSECREMYRGPGPA